MRTLLLVLVALAAGIGFASARDAGARTQDTLVWKGVTCKTLAKSIGCITTNKVTCIITSDSSACLPGWTKGGYAVAMKRVGVAVIENRTSKIVYSAKMADAP